MPIFEYSCNKCGKDFELIVNSSTKLVCEFCGSADIDKKLSVFAAHAGGADKAPPCAGGCCGFSNGACGSGMCGGH